MPATSRFSDVRERGTIRRAAAIAIGVIVAFATASALVQHEALNRAIEAAQSVEQTQAVRLSVERLRRALREAQVAAAAMALASDTDAASLLARARALASTQLDEIAALTAGDVEQQRRLAETRNVVAGRFAMHDAVAAAVARGDLAAARAGVASATAGVDASPTVRLLEELERTEQDRLAARRTVAQRDRVRTQVLLAVGSVFATGAMLALFGWSERTRARQRLEQSRQRYQELFELSPVPMLVVERDTLKLREFNAAAQRCYGHGRDDLGRATLEKLLSPADLPALRRFLAEAEHTPHGAGPPGAARDMVHLAADGRRLDVRVRATPLLYDRQPALILMVEDMSLQHAADRERAAAQRQLDELVEHMSEGFALLDGQWRYRYVNEKAAELLGRPKTALVGHVLWDLFPGARDSAFGQAARTAARDRVAVRIEELYEPWDRWFENVFYPVEDGLAIFFSDVTQRKRDERTLADRGKLLSDLSRRLLRAQEDERRAIARDLHDHLMQEMAAVKFALACARRADDPQVYRTSLDDALQSIDTLIPQLRNRALDLHPSILDDLGLPAALDWLSARQSALSGFPVEASTAPGMPRLDRTIEIAAYRIAQEAIGNALRHSGAVAVRVHLRLERDWLRLSVQDDGIGFDTEGPRGHGSLGLVSMRERAELLGGRLTIEASPGGGTRVLAELPASCESFPGADP